MKFERPVRVLIVDDSALFRRLISTGLGHHADIKVEGGAADALEARDQIVLYRPDVILLDLEIPDPGGLVLLRKLRENYPVPVIAMIAPAEQSSTLALAALELGALDVVAKPTDRHDVRPMVDALADQIRVAHASARPVLSRSTAATSAPFSFRATGCDPCEYLVAIGASTGGTDAVRAVLSSLPPDFPPVAIVQHMPAGFTHSFATRLNEACRLLVSEAVDGEVLMPGRAVVARGDRHMTIIRTSVGWMVQYTHQDPVNSHCPSIDTLFDSVEKSAGDHAIGVLLTGMGIDGAGGLLRIRNSGGITITQSAASCIVFDMPRAALEIGASMHSAAPEEVGAAIHRSVTTRRRAIPAALVV